MSEIEWPEILPFDFTDFLLNSTRFQFLSKKTSKIKWESTKFGKETPPKNFPVKKIRNERDYFSILSERVRSKFRLNCR